jgi:integrase
MAQRARGEGSIYRRKDGRYVAAVYVPMTDGTRRRVQLYGRTRADVSQRLTELMNRVQAGMPEPVSSMTVAYYLEQWLEQAKHRVRPLTFRSYEMYVRRHIVPALGRKRLRELNAPDIRRFITNLRKRPSQSPGRHDSALAPRTVNHIHAVLRNALEQAVREDLLARNVARQVQMTTVHDDDRVPLTTAEARKLMNAAARTRFNVPIALALALGLRRGEVLGLRWDDVDFKSRVLHIRRTLQRVEGELRLVPPKTRRSKRTIPLPSVLAAKLRQHRADHSRDTDLVFTTQHGTPINPNDLSKAIVRISKDAGIRRIGLHDLRHSCASFLLAQGVPPRVVMEILGHSTIDVTMNIYGHVMLDAQRKALRHIDDLVR